MNHFVLVLCNYVKTEKALDSSTANVLIVDDVEDNLEILRDLLTFDGYEVQTAQDGEAALKQVREERPDLILLDILMPGLSGFEVCERLKADEDTRDIPIVFVSSMADLESKVKGFKAGGVDYINKPYQHAEILVRINTHITMVRLRKDLEQRNTELENQANTDYLTDLYNRRWFYQVVEKKYKNTVQGGEPISITLLDLDNFKRVNDNHGHLVGDQVLGHVAQQIRSCCRQVDMVARYGGEEFAIMHPNTTSQEAFEVVEEIRKCIEVTPYVHEDNEIEMTLSAGIVDSVICQDCPRVDDLLSLADTALYLAKDSGRNQVVIFEY